VVDLLKKKKNIMRKALKRQEAGTEAEPPSLAGIQKLGVLTEHSQPQLPVNLLSRVSFPSGFHYLGRTELGRTLYVSVVFDFTRWKGCLRGVEVSNLKNVFHMPEISRKDK